MTENTENADIEAAFNEAGSQADQKLLMVNGQIESEMNFGGTREPAFSLTFKQMITPRGLKKANELRSTDQPSSFATDENQLIVEEIKTEPKMKTPTAGIDGNLLVKKSKTINFNAVKPPQEEKRHSSSSGFEVKSVEINNK